MAILSHRPDESSETKIAFSVNSFGIVRFLTVAELLLVGVISTIHDFPDIDTEERVTFDLHGLSLNIANFGNFLFKNFWLKITDPFLRNVRRLGTERS